MSAAEVAVFREVFSFYGADGVLPVARLAEVWLPCLALVAGTAQRNCCMHVWRCIYRREALGCACPLAVSATQAVRSLGYCPTEAEMRTLESVVVRMHNSTMDFDTFVALLATHVIPKQRSFAAVGPKVAKAFRVCVCRPCPLCTALGCVVRHRASTAPCSALLYRALLCYVVLCRVVLCSALRCSAASCCVVLDRAVPSRVDASVCAIAQVFNQMCRGEDRGVVSVLDFVRILSERGDVVSTAGACRLLMTFVIA